MNDLLQRRGLVKISDDLIRRDPERVMKILKDILVVKIDNDFMTRSLTYMAYSKHFDLIEDSYFPPIYVATVTSLSPKDFKTGNLEVKWTREKEYSEKSVKDMLEELKNEICGKKQSVFLDGEDKRFK